MQRPLLRLLISCRFISKHGHHRKFLFLIGRFIEIFYSETAWPNGPKRGRKSSFCWPYIYTYQLISFRGQSSFCWTFIYTYQLISYRGQSSFCWPYIYTYQLISYRGQSSFCWPYIYTYQLISYRGLLFHRLLKFALFVLLYVFFSSSSYSEQIFYYYVFNAVLIICKLM